MIGRQHGDERLPRNGLDHQPGGDDAGAGAEKADVDFGIEKTAELVRRRHFREAQRNSGPSSSEAADDVPHSRVERRRPGETHRQGARLAMNKALNPPPSRCDTGKNRLRFRHERAPDFG